MASSAKAVTNRLLDLADGDGTPIDPLRMEKLVYLAEGFTLAATDDPLFLEPIEAWDYGPVVPALYYALGKYGDGPIGEELWEYGYDGREVMPSLGLFSEDEAAIIEVVWEVFGQWDDSKLI